jgi:hypothetical protein
MVMRSMSFLSLPHCSLVSTASGLPDRLTATPPFFSQPPWSNSTPPLRYQPSRSLWAQALAGLPYRDLM